MQGGEGSYSTTSSVADWVTTVLERWEMVSKCALNLHFFYWKGGCACFTREPCVFVVVELSLVVCSGCFMYQGSRLVITHADTVSRFLSFVF